MGYCTYYDDRNKVTYQGLLIKYRVEPYQFEANGGQSYNGYMATRYATKYYAYVGMDASTAKSCQDAKLAQYTRLYAQANNKGQHRPVDPDPQPPELNEEIVECRSDIARTRQDGDMWTVTISVNEEDKKFSYDKITNPSSLFAAENGRNYDEDNGSGGEGKLTLKSVNRDGSLAIYQYEQNIEGFNPSNLFFQWKEDEQQTTWHTGTTVPETGNLVCQLTYKNGSQNIESNTLTLN